MWIIRTKQDLQSICIPYEWIGYDIETNALDPRKGQILLVSMTTPQETYVIDIIALGLQAYEYLKIPLTQSALVINHNIAFDYKWTVHHTNGKVELQNMVDVMINEQVLTAGIFMPTEEGKGTPFTLQAITWRRLGKLLKKDSRKEFINYTGGSLSDEAYEYAGEDTQVLREIYDQQLLEMKEKGLQRIFDLEARLIPVTAYMELTGITVDTDTLATFKTPIERYIQKCDQMLQDAFIANGAAETIYFYGDGYRCLNTKSKPQVIEALNRVGVNVDALNVKKLVKWDFKNRKKKNTAQIDYEQLLHEDDQDIGDAIEKYGGYENTYLRALAFHTGAEKLLSSYVDGILEKVDNKTQRWYPWFKQCGARATGRYSSNIQQIPKDDKLKRLGLDISIRNCFIAPKGRKLIIADFSAIELVILADRSGDAKLAYEHLHGDIHTIVCNQILSRWIPQAGEITKKNAKQHPYKMIRDFSKIFSYGICYGITGQNISDQAMDKLGSLNIKLTPEQGDEGIDMWKSIFPDAGTYLNNAARKAITQGYTESIWGRKRYYDLEAIRTNKWRRLAAAREGSNMEIQATCSDLLKQSMIYCFNMLHRNKARIVMAVHDEIVLESLDEYVDQASHVLKYSMETAAKEMLSSLGHSVIVNPSMSTKYDK